MLRAKSQEFPTVKAALAAPISSLRSASEGGAINKRDWRRAFSFNCRSCSLKGRSFKFTRRPFTHFRILRVKSQEFPTVKAALAAPISSFRSASEGIAINKRDWRRAFTFNCRSCSFKGRAFTQIRILRAKAQEFPVRTPSQRDSRATFTKHIEF